MIINSTIIRGILCTAQPLRSVLYPCARLFFSIFRELKNFNQNMDLSILHYNLVQGYLEDRTLLKEKGTLRVCLHVEYIQGERRVKRKRTRHPHSKATKESNWNWDATEHVFLCRSNKEIPIITNKHALVCILCCSALSLPSHAYFQPRLS